jgi:cytoskeletal protein RodZ
MSSFGSRLKHERESRGVTLKEISGATNVGLHLLEALETNDFKTLPGGPFNKGFVRAYARHLGIDVEAAVDAYSREEKALGLETPDAHRHEPEEPVKLYEMRKDGERMTMILDLVLVKRVAAGAAALLVLLLLTWLLWPSGQASPPAAQVQPTAPEPSPQTADLPAPTNTPDPMPMAPVEPAGAQDSPGTRSAQEPAEQIDAPPAVPPATQPDATLSQAVAPAPAPAATDSPLTITEYGVGTGVADKMLIGRGDRFTVGTQIWFWTRTLGGSQGEVLTHVWMHEDGQVIRYERNLGGAHWRNSSRKSLISTSVGSWVVEARDSAGRVLARTAFRCVAS